jgi:hypothetical protein
MTDDAIYREANRLVDEINGKPPAIMAEAMIEAAEKLAAGPFD